VSCVSLSPRAVAIAPNRSNRAISLVRRANVDAVVRRALTGHVTERKQRHYSHVSNHERRAAMAGILRLLPPFHL
jgi:hypothetical protein